MCYGRASGCLSSVQASRRPICSEVCSMWRLHRHIRLLLLHIPLSREIRHVGLHATIILLWLHDLHLLWILPYSGDCQFPCAFAVRWMHISGPQIEDINKEATTATSVAATATFSINLVVWD